MTSFSDILVQHYGWAGLAVVALFFVLVMVQIIYYSVRYRRVGSYLNNRCRQKVHAVPPTVSLVVPMFSEDYTYIEETLPAIMSQEGVNFEVIIVYVGSDSDFFEDIMRLKQILGNITITKIERNERFPISIKTALNIGIKAARNEHILFTTTNTHPTSERWLSLMSKGFQRGDVVLGYCGMERGEGFAAQYIRTSRMVESVGWLSAAVVGKPYRAIHTNMGFTKSLYFGVNGFDHLNMNIGEDDLFMQRIMSGANTSIILNPKATVVEKSWGGGSWWLSQQRYYRSAEKLYPAGVLEPQAWEMTSRVLMFLLLVVMVVFMPLEIKVVALLLALLRLLFMLLAVRKVAQRLGEKGLVASYVLYDVLSPWCELILRMKMLKRDERVWR